MPPKKKGKKGKAKKNADSGPILRPESPPISELSKQFYLIQIKDLDNKLIRYQEKCDELRIKAKEHEEQYIQICKDKKEIVDFLKKTLEQRQDEICDLQDRLTALQQVKDQERETFDKQMTEMKREFQEVRDQLTSENMILGGKLSSLEEFKIQKEDLMKKFADLEEQLKQQEADHKDTIYNLERKAVVDKDRLKKEMILRVNEVAAEFRKVSNKQMAETTKRNIRENLSMNVQLNKMSEKTRDLIHENDSLKETEKELRIQIKLLESCQNEMAKKNNSNLKVLEMITSKAKEQEMFLEELENRDEDYVLLEDEANEIKEKYKEMKKELENANSEVEKFAMKVEESEMKEKIAIAAKDRIEDVLAATAYSLREVMCSDFDKDEDALAKRKSMIERLLLILDTSVVVGKGPIPADLLTKKLPEIMLPINMNKAVNGVSQVEPISTHYKLGDLGLIPRPDLDKRSAVRSSQVAHLSATTRIGVKEPPSKIKHVSLALKHQGVLPPISSDSV